MLPENPQPTRSRMRAFENGVPRAALQSDEQLPTLPNTQGDRLITRLTPVRNSEGNLQKYILTTPRGQEIEYDPTDVELILLKRTFANITADQWESIAPLDLAASIKTQLKALGLSSEDIPSDPEALIQKAAAIYKGTHEIQKSVTLNKEENVLQSLLDLEIDVLTGGKEAWGKLNPIQKESVVDITQTLVAHVLQQMGVGREAVEMAKIIQEVDETLLRRKTNFAGVFGKQSGLMIGNFIEEIGIKMLPLLAGRGAENRGIIGAAKDSALDIIEGAATAIEDTQGKIAKGARTALDNLKGKP